jgi:hypothetical protein
MIVVSALATGVVGCSTVNWTAKHPVGKRWYCMEVDGRGDTGENVECRSVETDPSDGQSVFDGPPVPLRTLDPTPRPFGWHQFLYNYGAWVIAIPVTGALLVLGNHEWQKAGTDK